MLMTIHSYHQQHLADAPHEVITNCSLCHTGATYADPVPNSACDSCHTAGGANKPSYPTAQDVMHTPEQENV